MNRREFYDRTTNAIAQYWRQELGGILPGTHYRIREAISGPRTINLLVVANPRYSAKIMGMSEALSQAAGLDAEQTIRIARGQAGGLSVEIPVPRELWFNISIRQLPARRWLKATVGLDTEHRPTLVDFASPVTAHCLVAGATGSGKTNAQRLLVYDLAIQNGPDEVRFVLIDTRKRGSGWRPFVDLPHLAHPVITDDPTALRALAWAVAEVDRRSIKGQTRPRVFIGIDEAQSVLEQPHFVKSLGDLAAVGREFGVHLIMAMQNPTSKQLGDTAIKRNVTVRLVGRTDSSESARVAAGIGGSGAEQLTGVGDFLLVQPDGVRRLTTALLSEADINRLPRAESVDYLDLAEYEDVDHVLDQAANVRKDVLEPEHVLVALATGRGITWLASHLGIGSSKARRVKDFADAMRESGVNRGYTSIPLIPPGDSQAA